MHLTDERLCKAYYKDHSNYKEDEECYVVDGTQLLTLAECESYYMTPDFSGGCYLDDGIHEPDPTFCDVYYNYADFDYDGFCYDLSGDIVYAVEDCKNLYKRFDFERDGGCYDTSGTYHSDIDWCYDYY